MSTLQMIRHCFLLAGLLLTMESAAQTTRFINPDQLIKPPGYTHVVITGNTIYISGQVPANDKGEVIGKGDFRAQATRVYENLGICLAAAGLTFADVVKMNTYVVNLKPEDVTTLREVRKKYLAQDHLPASTLVGVTALASPDFLLEIEAIAVKN